MLKKILFVVALLLIGLVVVVAIQPTDFSITRATSIAAPPEVVFPHVNDLQQWEAWSPWAKLDPNAKHSFAGPSAGEGAAMSWSGNSQVGEGTMTIIESRPNELVRFRLDFIKPFEASSLSAFTFKTENGQTAITWTMDGKNNFIGKAVSLFMDCDKMVGGQFEEGFANLAATVNASSKN